MGFTSESATCSTFRPTSMDLTSVLRELQVSQRSEQTNLEASHRLFGEYSQHVEEEADDSPSPSVRALQVESPDSIKIMTGFTDEEFNMLWMQVESVVVPAWLYGRGRKCKTDPKDVLMALCVLKHYGTWQKHASDFHLRTATFEKIINRMFDLIEPVLFQAHVQVPSMRDQERHNNTFKNYPYALYAHDVKFQVAYRPTGAFNEQKRYFSGKHKLYGYKVECSVVLPGIAIHVSNHYPGAASDLTIAVDNKTKHEEMLKKTSEEAAVREYGEGSHTYPDSWAMLVDKGYEGFSRSVRTIQPKKKPRGGVLSQEDLARNVKVSSDRVLVENYFG